VGALCGEASDAILIRVQDRTLPRIAITTPVSGAILGREQWTVAGTSDDIAGIDSIDVRVDNGTWVNASGTQEWTATIDATGLTLGDHRIEARALDSSGLETVQVIPVAVNESGHTWGPQINEVIQLPQSPVNTSNIIIEANVTTESPYALRSVILWFSDGTTATSCMMYRYADLPVQARHEEDPLRNESNLPVFGCELGQFPAGTTISYWVVGADTAANVQQSNVQLFTVAGD
jgi:hypothetical protein